MVGIVRDEGRSAANLKRSGIRGILADVARPKARAWDALVVVKLDRLTRSVRDLCTLVESFERGAVHFVSIGEVTLAQPLAGGGLRLRRRGAQDGKKLLGRLPRRGTRVGDMRPALRIPSLRPGIARRGS